MANMARYISEGIRPDTMPYHNVELVIPTPDKAERPETRLCC